MASKRLHSFFYSIVLPVQALRTNSSSSDEFLFFFFCKRLTYFIRDAISQRFYLFHFRVVYLWHFFLYARNEIRRLNIYCECATVHSSSFVCFFFFSHRNAQNQESNVIYFAWQVHEQQFYVVCTGGTA